MKLQVVFTLGLLTALPSALPAQESSKAAATSGIEIVELLDRYAKRTGKDFVIDARVRSQVTLAGIDANELSWPQLLAILDVHQIAVVDSGGILAVVPDANARQLPTPVYTDVAFKAQDHEIVTLLVQPKKICAAFMVPVLRPLMPQSAHLAAEVQTNTLIINDHAVNVRRIAELAQQLDRRATDKHECPPPSGMASFGKSTG